MAKASDPNNGLTKLWEEENMVFALYKEGEWVDHGRGRLRIWQRDKDKVKWMSFVSDGTKRELLTLHSWGGNIDNRIILTKDTSFYNPNPHDEGVLMSSNGKYFLFKTRGSKRIPENVDVFEEKEKEDTEAENPDEHLPKEKEDYKTQVAMKLLEILKEHSTSKPLVEYVEGKVLEEQ